MNKRGIENIVKNVILTLGGISFIFSGCQKPQTTLYFKTQQASQEIISKQHVSKLENEIYDYVNELSREIPKEFIKTPNLYHNHSLIIADCETAQIEDGKGRLVFGYKSPETIVAGYGDAEEFKEYDKTKNPKVLKSNISFGRMIFDENLENMIDEIIILNKSNIHIIYIKKDRLWRKGVCEGSYHDLPLACQNYIENNGEIISQQQIQKYIDLSDRFKKVYFDNFKPQPTKTQKKIFVFNKN